MQQKQWDQLEGSLDQGDSNGDGEKWSDIEYILKVEPTGFVNGLECEVSDKKKSRVMSRFLFVCLFKQLEESSLHLLRRVLT